LRCSNAHLKRTELTGGDYEVVLLEEGVISAASVRERTNSGCGPFLCRREMFRSIGEATPAVKQDARQRASHSLPEVDGPYSRRPGAALYDLGFENDLDVLFLPISGELLRHLIHAMLVHQKFACRNCPTTADTGSHY
jgi:hypothetical protein